MDLEFDEEYKKKISAEFERAMEYQFNEYNPTSRYGSNQRYKLNGECSTYRNYYLVWNINIYNFTANIEEGQVNGHKCKFVSVPHKELGMAQYNFSQKKK